MASIVVLLSYLAAFLATSLALAAWQRKPTSWTRPIAVMMLALAQWSLALALELTARKPEAVSIWRSLQIVGAAIMPAAWFVFVAHYSAHDGLVSGYRRRILYVIPAITIVLAFTNPRHRLIWTSLPAANDGAGGAFGWWHTLQLLYSLSLTLCGLALLGPTMRRMKGQPRWNPPVIALGIILPLSGYLLQTIGYESLGRLALLPLFLGGGVACLAWTVVHQQIFDLVPIAREMVLNNMTDGVLVVNSQDRIVEINPAAEAIIDRPGSEVLGQRIVEIMPQWSDIWYDAVIKGEVHTEIKVTATGNERCYDLRFTPIYTGSGHASGRLLVMRDITEHKRTENQLLGQRQLFANLVAVARATSEGASLQATLQNALDVTTGLTRAEYGSLFLLDSGGRVTHSILARGKTAPGSRRKIVGTVMDKGLAGWAVRNRQTALIYDTADDDRWVTFPDQPYTARSVLVVPITSGRDVPGVLTLQHSQRGVFDEDDEALLRAASDQMALALHKAQLFEEQLHLGSRQRILYEALTTLGGHLEPATVVHLAAETIARLTGWSAVGIYAPHKDNGKLKLRAGAGLLAERQGSERMFESGALERAFNRGRTLALLGVEPSDDEYDERPCLPSAIFVPLQHAGSQLGLLVVGAEDAAALNEDDVLLAESLAETVALAMTNAQLFQEIADEHRRLEALIESSRDGIILVGHRQHVLFLNHTSIELLGLAGEPEDWMYRPLSELLAPLGVDSHYLHMSDSQDDSEEMTVAEGEFDLKARSLRWQNLPVRTEMATLGRLVVLEDVSKERALQRMREDLTHTMVHDLRNPLNIVSGSLEMMDQRLPDMGGDAQHLLDIARQSTERMLHLVNGILNISRLESGKMPLNRAQVDLPELIDLVLDANMPLAHEKGIRMCRLNGVQGESVSAAFVDEELVERILQNLVGNAIKFTPPGGSITVQTLEESDDMVKIAVRDSGPGIPQDIRDQLFEKFVTGLQAQRGSGLGLAFCRMAVEAHGGRIWIESRPGDGASFFFTLPKAPVDEES
ncbi:MAG TPA: histidine kinase N-terminal 7TM domain-containing protein [Candidatus Binatia bacterium]|nr:histidine kinase N-terminal 7TM domain-containing protein [Candidatus Binatia bacterium]